MVMKPDDLKTMSVDELWTLYDEITAILATRLAAKMVRLENRLRQLGRHFDLEQKQKLKRERRPYPPVWPKFRNPLQPLETWSGRGKQPRWLATQLRSGRKLDDFRIGSRSDISRQRPRIAVVH
jgi:DNA-binding protein H-NS